MNYEAAAADLKRFLKIIAPAQAALDALTLTGQVQDALVADQAKLDAARLALGDVLREQDEARAKFAEEQAAHQAFIADARKHVAKARAEADRIVAEAKAEATAARCAADDDIAAARDALAAEHAEGEVAIADLARRADAEQARLDAIRSSIAKHLGA